MFSSQFITDLLNNTGPFKGTLRETSLFPVVKDNPKVQESRKDYLSFMCNIKNRRKIVFTDKKPMNGQDIYIIVRRDPLTGIIPENKGGANNINIYSMLTVCTLKKHIQNFDFLAFEQTAHFFLLRS